DMLFRLVVQIGNRKLCTLPVENSRTAIGNRFVVGNSDDKALLSCQHRASPDLKCFADAKRTSDSQGWQSLDDFAMQQSVTFCDNAQLEYRASLIGTYWVNDFFLCRSIVFRQTIGYV